MSLRCPHAVGDELVSVIIPAFNGERHLGEALDSVFQQIGVALDVVVVDDGSTDGTESVVRSWGNRVCYLRKPNGGTASARNMGVRATRGGWLAFLDQDDVWEPRKLERQLTASRETPEIGLVFGMVEQFVSPDSPGDFRLRVRCPSTPVPGYLPSAMLVRRETFLEVGYFDERWRLGEWADWYGRFRRASIPSLMIPHVVTRRRLHVGNKGVTHTDFRREYVRVVRESLALRRVGNLVAENRPSTA